MIVHPPTYLFFFFNDTATTEIYTLSLHDALPIYPSESVGRRLWRGRFGLAKGGSGNERWCLPRCQSPQTGASSRGACGTSWDGFREYRGEHQACLNRGRDPSSANRRARKGGQSDDRRWV